MVATGAADQRFCHGYHGIRGATLNNDNNEFFFRLFRAIPRNPWQKKRARRASNLEESLLPRISRNARSNTEEQQHKSSSVSFRVIRDIRGKRERPARLGDITPSAPSGLYDSTLVRRGESARRAPFRSTRSTAATKRP